MLRKVSLTAASLIAQLVKNVPAMQETLVPFLGREDPLEKGMHDKPLQYSCLENPMDREAWHPAVHEAAKRRTQLSE